MDDSSFGEELQLLGIVIADCGDRGPVGDLEEQPGEYCGELQVEDMIAPVCLYFVYRSPRG